MSERSLYDWHPDEVRQITGDGWAGAVVWKQFDGGSHTVHFNSSPTRTTSCVIPSACDDRICHLTNPTLDFRVNGLFGASPRDVASVKSHDGLGKTSQCPTLVRVRRIRDGRQSALLRLI